MTKSTDRIEKILRRVRDARKMVREEMLEGYDCGSLAHDLECGEHTLTQRLVQLREHNEREEKVDKALAAALLSEQK